jgi:hypothetical protein
MFTVAYVRVDEVDVCRVLLLYALFQGSNNMWKNVGTVFCLAVVASHFSVGLFNLHNFNMQ